MMLEIAAAREGFRNKVISDIGFVRSKSNFADGLKKSMSKATLRDILKNGNLVIKFEEWII